MRKPDAALRETIDIGRPVLLTPVATETLVSNVVRHDQDDVGVRLGGVNECGRKEHHKKQSGWPNRCVKSHGRSVQKVERYLILTQLLPITSRNASFV